jgi:hypothetical protein
MGAYDKEPNKNARFRPKKTNWAVIDDAYCLRFNEAIKKALETNPGARISKAFVAGALGLRDKSLRNFPKVRQLTKEASSTLIRDSSPHSMRLRRSSPSLSSQDSMPWSISLSNDCSGSILSVSWPSGQQPIFIFMSL